MGGIGQGMLENISPLQQSLRQLLVELDGFEQMDGVVVIGATTVTTGIDPALTRPGRLKLVSLQLPDRRGRQEILELYAKNISLSANVSFSRLADRTAGMTAAQLQEILNLAATRAGATRGSLVTMTHLGEAADAVVLGSKSRILMSDKEKNQTAYHEAGHALVGVRTTGADPVQKVTIIPRGGSLGSTESTPTEDKHTLELFELRAQLDVCMGGRVAEELTFGPDHVSVGCASDLDKAWKLAKIIVRVSGRDIETKQYSPTYEGDPMEKPSEWMKKELDLRRQQVMIDSHARVTELLNKHVKELHSLAEELYHRETLDRDEIQHILNGTMH
eukprot:gnl/TRDRNA2_/TRDRNA2_88602_c0_seq1.p1 gnl/TRDRNA2_/TRDRNA2_88602_c0~~gnl/TRDRNA2_/TRDRNA2_88602_c0_seq1.p1  ORF type:complete len:332 (-),score=44.64 gnl/TRDRNA2_/TRDRNA2_88602_c0_seq1:92-1087(-)